MKNQVYIGTLLPGAQEVHRENINKVWRGNVLCLDGANRPFYIKQIPERTIVVEILCASLGRYLGLPIPLPGLVNVEPNVLPGFGNKEAVTFYGSLSINKPDLRQRLGESNLEEVVERLSDWGLLLPSACFDEWIANNDRHVGNILYGGKDDFVLIDHSHAIPERLLHDAPASANHLLEVCKETKDGQSIYDDSKKIIRDFPGARNSLSAKMLELAEVLTCTKTTADIKSFLEQRIDALQKLISARVEYEQHLLEL